MIIFVAFFKVLNCVRHLTNSCISCTNIINKEAQLKKKLKSTKPQSTQRECHNSLNISTKIKEMQSNKFDLCKVQLEKKPEKRI